MNIDFDKKPKNNRKIYFIIAIIVLLIFAFITCGIFLIGSNLQESGIEVELPFSNKIEEQTIAYLQEKYNISATIRDVEDITDFYYDLNETQLIDRTKIKLIYAELEENEITIFAEKKGSTYKFYDDYESEKYERDLEIYFKEKFGINANVSFNIGDKYDFGNNLINEKYTETFEVINDNNLEFYAFIETPDDLNIKDLSVKDFPEIFNNNSERKIIIGKTYTKNDIGFVSSFDIGLHYDEIEFDLHLPQYAVYFKEFKVLSNTGEKYYNYNKIKDGQIYLLNPEVVEEINLENNAILEKNVSNLKELKLDTIQQLSGKYTFKIKEKETAYIAIHREDFGILDPSKFFDIDAILSEKDKEYEQAYGMPIGDYMVFSLYPKEEDISMFVFKEYY